MQEIGQQPVLSFGNSTGDGVSYLGGGALAVAKARGTAHFLIDFHKQGKRKTDKPQKDSASFRRPNFAVKIPASFWRYHQKCNAECRLR